LALSYSSTSSSRPLGTNLHHELYATLLTRSYFSFLSDKLVPAEKIVDIFPKLVIFLESHFLRIYCLGGLVFFFFLGILGITMFCYTKCCAGSQSSPEINQRTYPYHNGCGNCYWIYCPPLAVFKLHSYLIIIPLQAVPTIAQHMAIPTAPAPQRTAVAVALVATVAASVETHAITVTAAILEKYVMVMEEFML